LEEAAAVLVDGAIIHLTMKMVEDTELIML
jgi:hypothetical protein